MKPNMAMKIRTTYNRGTKATSDCPPDVRFLFKAKAPACVATGVVSASPISIAIRAEIRASIV